MRGLRGLAAGLPTAGKTILEDSTHSAPGTPSHLKCSGFPSLTNAITPAQALLRPTVVPDLVPLGTEPTLQTAPSILTLQTPALPGHWPKTLKQMRVFPAHTQSELSGCGTWYFISPRHSEA